MSAHVHPTFAIKPQIAEFIRWSSRGSCGNRGCSDPECCCALCGEPVGVPEDDPLWATHDEYCDDCELCRDGVPPILFRGEGEAMQQATFHHDCFVKIIEARQ